MFDSNVNEWIKYNVEDYMEEDLIDSSTGKLDKYLSYIHDSFGDGYYVHLLKMSEANDLSKRTLLKNFADIEGFMGRMGSVLNLKTSDRYKPFNNESGRVQWTLAHLYKQAFNVIEESDNLSEISKRENLDSRYISNRDNDNLKTDRVYHYLKLYNFRNTIGSHYDDTNNISRLSKKEIDDVISSMLVVELDLCAKFDEELKKVYQHRKEQHLKESYNARQYAEDIEISYLKRCEEGFYYLDTCWDSLDNTEDDKKNIAEFVSSRSNTVTLFLGEAGTGKTTALRQLEYLFAMQCIRSYGQKNIPIFIELKNITLVNNPIRYEIGRRLKYGPEVVDQIIKDGNIILLLDGWNEIRNKETENQIREEMNNLINKHDQKMFVTDRSDNNMKLNIISGINRCYLHELSFADKEKYFRNNCKPETLNVILEQMEKEKEGLVASKPIYNLKTPLMLLYFQKVVEDDNEIPRNFIAKYIEQLLNREEKEQKDADDPRSFETLRYILSSLAVIYEHDIFTAGDALMTIGKTKQLFGFNQPDSMQFLELTCKMGILEKNDEFYQFKTDEFQDYFENFALVRGIDDKLREMV